MPSISMDVYSLKHIGTTEYAKKVFAILEKYDILPDKIGDYEPLRTSFSLDEAINMWTTPGGTSPDFRMGSIICKKKNPNVRVDVAWHIGERARVNYIAVWFTKKSFSGCRAIIEGLFKDLITQTHSFYGYISDFGVADRQHVTGTIETRMDGIFWCNYFGEVYVNFFGRDKIMTAPWFKIEKFGKNGIITYLTQEPTDGELIDSPELEDKLKKYLGKDAFGDAASEAGKVYDDWRDAIADRQIKDVPKLDFSEIRKPLASF